jgi:RND family efflux transporter MFP subunit
VAEAQLNRARQAYERQEGLQGSTAFSKAQFEDLRESVSEARSVLARARAEASQAEAELARAQYDLENATIRAPFAGVVTERHAQPGAYVGLGAPIATLLDPRSLEIEVDMPVRLVPSLSEGMTVPARFGDGPEMTARLRSVLPVEAVSTRTRPVRFALDLDETQELRLASGKSVTLSIPVSAPRKALTIPKDALVQSRGSWIVYTVEDGKAAPRDVALGQPTGERIEITRGLLPGDTVVVRGNERLRPGQPVTPRPADPAAETAAAPSEQG